MAAGQVVLADGPVHGQRVLGDMGGQGAVGAVDAVGRALVDDDRQLGGRYGQGFDAADRADLPGAGNEHGGLAALVGEQVRGVDAARSAAGGQGLRADDGLELAESSPVPGAGVVDVDDRGDGGGAGPADAAVADVGVRQVLGAE